MPISPCPLCLCDICKPFYRDKRRDYFRCSSCQLVFVPVHQHLTTLEEKAIYDLHQNQIEDAGYRRFLSRLATPLSARLQQEANGLDYGCGPGPLLAKMLEEQGHKMQIYDPHYADLPNRLQCQYDFITCTEVVEHFRQPHAEFNRLFSLLKPNGLLGIMTKLVIDAEAFSCWHYKNDLTHVSFFSESTFAWLARRYHCEYELLGKDVILMRKTQINAT